MEDNRKEKHLNALEYGEVYYFQDWPNTKVPKIAAGVYTIWQDTQFVYVGMAGRSLTVEDITNHRQSSKVGVKGLYSRLNSHASGRRSGDQFCVYVADRLVLSGLTKEQVEAIGKAKLSMDALVKKYIREKLSYRFIEVIDSKEAFTIEGIIRSKGLSCNRPLLNPINSR